MQNEREFASAIIILYMHCNKIEEFMEIIIGWENIKEIILGVILKPRGLPWGQGVCQMIILLYLGGGGQNSQKMATWFKDDPHQHIITCSCIQFLPTFMNIKYHQNE